MKVKEMESLFIGMEKWRKRTYFYGYKEEKTLQLFIIPLREFLGYSSVDKWNANLFIIVIIANLRRGKEKERR